MLTANAEGATVLRSIPASSDTVESEGTAREPVVYKLLFKNPKIYPKQIKKNLKKVLDACAYGAEHRKRKHSERTDFV